jgi:penicillin-binding protein 1A
MWESERWQTARESLMPKTDQLKLREVDLDRVMTIEKLENEKKGSGFEKLDTWLSTGYINHDMETNYKNLLRSPDWASVKKEMQAMNEAYNKPTKMKIFSYNSATDERDTVMTPYDSLRYTRMILQTGSISVNPHNGHIKSWVGGVGFRFFKLDHAGKNTRRQVGSTIKPLLYGISIDYRGFSPCQVVTDQAWTICPGEGDFRLASCWHPHNAGGEGQSGRSLSLYEALTHSLNSVSAFLMKEMKSTKPFREFLAKAGIDTSNVPAQPSICLGTPDISVYEMVGAYTLFANEGVYMEPVYVTRVEDKHGNVILDMEAEQKTRQALSKSAAYAMVSMLKYVVKGNNSGYDGIKSQIGGKTGTTQDQSDGWFMGISPNLVVGTWVGCEDRFLRFRSMSLGQGARMARPIFQKLMRKIEADPQLKWDTQVDFVKPDPMAIELNCSLYSAPSEGGPAFKGMDDEGYGDEFDNLGKKDTAKANKSAPKPQALSVGKAPDPKKTDPKKPEPKKNPTTPAVPSNQQTPKKPGDRH